MYTRIFIFLIVLPALAWAGFTDMTTVYEELAYGLRDIPSAWCDFNNDGYEDLYDGRLFRNNGGTSFTQQGGFGWGVWADYNNDGYSDVFSLEQDQVMRNNGGSGSFTSVTTASLAGSDNRGACWADLDGDAYVDLYVGAYEASGYETDSVLMNNQGSKFTRTWTEPTVDGIRFPGRGVTACDFDQDGDMDVYVSNYRLEANYLWQNNGSGGLTDVAETYGVHGTYNGWRYSYGHSIGSCWGDMNNDGYIDLFAGNFSHPNDWQDRARFYRNLGPTGSWRFAQEWELTGGAWQESYASPSLADYDNDGDLDLYYTTVYGGDNSRLWRNDGNWKFTDVTSAQGLGGMPTTYQAAWGDYNNDGFLDLVTGGRLYKNNGNGNHWLKVLLKGDGSTVNSSAIGAQVRINLGGGQILTRQVEAGTGEGNQNSRVLHFGLGSRGAPVTLEIFWPDGTTKTVPDVAVDQLVTENQKPPALSFSWGASMGFFYSTASHGIVTHLGDSALARLYLAPDGEIDEVILPGGQPDGDDILLDGLVVRNNGNWTPREKFAAFEKALEITFQEGTVYGVMFSSEEPDAGQRYYRGSGLSTDKLQGGDDDSLVYDFNVDSVNGDTWNGTVGGGGAGMTVQWTGSYGFVDEKGDPILSWPGEQALAQLIYSADDEVDPLLPGGIPQHNDVVLDCRILRNNGGQWEDWAWFDKIPYHGPFVAGFVYGILYEDVNPTGNTLCYVGPIRQASMSSVYDFNTDLNVGNTWNDVVENVPMMDILWTGSYGFVNESGTPILPEIGDEAAIQLIYSPDSVMDMILPGGIPGGDDVVLDYGVVRNMGVLYDDWGWFDPISYRGPFQAGFVYGVIYENNVLALGDKYYAGPMKEVKSNLQYDLNTNFENGNTWNGMIQVGHMYILWGAQAGFVDHEGKPVLPGISDRAKVLFVHSPDFVADVFLSDGSPSANDKVLYRGYVSNNGGNHEAYAPIAQRSYTGSYRPGFVYGVIFENENPQPGDQYYVGPLKATALNKNDGPKIYELNSNLTDGNSWNRIVAPSTYRNISWTASFGFIDGAGSPILSSIGDEAMVQLLYSADGMKDPILPGGIPAVNDVVLQVATVRNSGGMYEDWGCFEPLSFSMPEQDGFIYGMIYENSSPQPLDQYYAGPMKPSSVGLYDLNTNYQDGNTWNGAVVSHARTFDVDGDGLPNDFEMRYFSGLELGLPDEDPDQDRFSNIQEYLAGTDPMNAESWFRIRPLRNQNEFPAAVMLRDTSGFRRYVIEYNEDILASDVWVPLDVAISGNGGDVMIPDEDGGLVSFRAYRGKVSLPSQ